MLGAGPHLPKWRGFVKRSADKNAVGLWHETYVIGCSDVVPAHGGVSADLPGCAVTRSAGRLRRRGGNRR
ncbi:DUF4188 domain-containing protein [Gordonia sp. HY285]|nr:DUF4188 domain-containing protein [Gordonia liuliyuniae]MCF8609298.1 DUF4188 domain-containing protein [Gordonia liuliyuniae]